MKLINWKTELAQVADAWRRQYQGYDGSWKESKSGSSKLTYDKLCAIDLSTAMPEDVAAIIDNDSWVRRLHRCDNCKGEFQNVVELGEEPDYESRTATICEMCLQYAIALIKGSDV